MFNERVFTIEQVAEHMQVTAEEMKEEVFTGRLRALKIGEHLRIRESDLNAYLNGAQALPDTGKNSAHADEVIALKEAPNFYHTWPDGKKELFTDVREGVAVYRGMNYRVKVGFTTRPSAGKERRRALVLVDRYPTVEFVSAGENNNGPMASIIKDRTGKQLPVGAPVPPEYADLKVGPYQDVVVGPGASNGLAVICDAGDLQTMVKHALIRYRFREERQ